MQFKDLNNFIEIEDKRIRNKYTYPDEQKHILARTVKLMEEVGELSNEILGFNSMQRNDKLSSRENLEFEFADVIITTLLLAKSTNVDIQKALKLKIKKINKRYEI